MPFVITFQPLDKTLPFSQNEFKVFGERIIGELINQGVFARYAKEYGLEVSSANFRIIINGICPIDESSEYLARLVSSLLYSVGLGLIISLTNSISLSVTADEKQLTMNDLKPRSLNAVLLEGCGLDNIEIPKELKCLISYQLMDDPVYFEGCPDNKYDRSSLQFWLFKQQKFIDPYRRIPVKLSDIKEDYATKSKISKFMSETLSETLQTKKQLEILRKKYNLINTDSQEKLLRRAAMLGNINDVEFLVNMKPQVNVNLQDDNPKQRKTALHWAIKCNHFVVVTILLKAGAKMDIGDAEGKTARDYAKKSGNAEILKALDSITEHCDKSTSSSSSSSQSIFFLKGASEKQTKDTNGVDGKSNNQFNRN